MRLDTDRTQCQEIRIEFRDSGLARTKPQMGRFGDAAISETLEKAGLLNAKSMIVATNEEIKNLSIAVNTRAMKNDA